jgi:hypothetical protein
VNEEFVEADDEGILLSDFDRIQLDTRLATDLDVEDASSAASSLTGRAEADLIQMKRIDEVNEFKSVNL